jgi:dipicolinate synthase subunit B
MAGLNHKRIGFGVTGFFARFTACLGDGAVAADGRRRDSGFFPAGYETDTRFFARREFLDAGHAITGRLPIHTIVDAEPIGPRKLLDIMVIAPCTGNTAAKMTLGITDTAVLMAAKAQLRNGARWLFAIFDQRRPVINNANIGRLLNTRNVFLVPYGQENAASKPYSLVAHIELIPDTCELALEGVQIQPLLREYKTGEES